MQGMNELYAPLYYLFRTGAASCQQCVGGL